MIVPVTPWSVVFFLVCVAVLLFVSIKRRSVFNILAVVFLLRFALAIYFTASAWDYYDLDGLVARAEGYADMDSFSSLISSIPLTAYIYSWVVGLIWYAIGVNDIMLVSLFNALLSFLCCVVVYDLATKFFSKKTSVAILMIVSIFPTLLIQSAGYANRESLFILPFLLSIRLAYEYYAKGKLASLLWSMFCAVIASVVHTVGIALFVLILIVSIKSSKGRYRNVFKVTLPILLSLLMIGLFSSGVGTEKLYNASSGVELVGGLQESRSAGRAAYLQGVEINSVADMLIFGPVKILYFIAAPFVWMVRNISDVYGMLDGFVYLALIVAIYKSGVLRVSNKYSKFLKYLTLTLVIMAIMLAFGTSNYGTAMRHRAKLLMPTLVVAGVFIENRNRRRVSS